MGWQLVGHWRLADRYALLHLITEDDNGLPSKFRRKVAPKIWYFLVNAGAVHFLPFLGIYWAGLGFSMRQIGLLQALRPWVSAAAGEGDAGCVCGESPLPPPSLESSRLSHLSPLCPQATS